MSRILCLFVFSIVLGVDSASATIVFDMPRLTFPSDYTGEVNTLFGGKVTIPSTPQQ